MTDQSAIESIAFSNNGRYMACGGKKGLRLFNISNLKKPESIFNKPGHTYQILFSPNSEQLATIINFKCFIFKLEKMDCLMEQKLDIQDQDDYLAFSKDSTILAMGE